MRIVGITMAFALLANHTTNAAGHVGAPAAAPEPAPAITTDKLVQHLAPPLGADVLSIADGLPNSNVRAIVQDQRGFIWLGTQDGLARYDGTTVRVFRPNDKDPTSVSGSYITSLAIDPTGKLWVGTSENGADLYDPDTDTFTRFVSGKAGLTADGVTAIARDRKDRIWLAMSGGGLERFEPGTGTFTAFSAKPLDVAFTAIDVDTAGNLWLGTATDGIVRWNPDNGTSLVLRPGQDGLGSAPVMAIRVAKNGHVWIASDGEGAFELDPAAKKVVRYHHDAAGAHALSDDHASALFEDKAGAMWIGTVNGLNRSDPSGGIVQYIHDGDDPTTFPSPGVEAIYQDKGGVMWIGTFADGVAKFDEFRMKFGYHHTRSHSLSFFEDADRTLWVGTYADGLLKYERGEQRVTIYRTLVHNLTTPGKVVALNKAWIAAVHRDRRGTLWISLKGHGLVAFDTKSETFRELTPNPDDPKSLPSDTVFDIWEDSTGNLWLATWGAGLVRFDPQAGTFTAFTSENGAGMPSNHLYKLYPDPKEKTTLWIGTTKGGLVRFDTIALTATGFRHKPEDPNSLSSDDVTTIYRDRGGMLWVGTFGGGLNRLDPTTGKATHLTTQNSKLTNDTVLGILPDDSGRLWISTNGGGLLQLAPEGNKLEVYTAADGVQNNEFAQGSFLRSTSGELFFGGTGGFNAFFPKNITRDTYVPPVVITAFKVFNQDVRLDRPIETLPALHVSYQDSFQIEFAALAFASPKKNRYAYKLEGFDDTFIETDRPFATYTKLNGGKYTLRVRASNQHGMWNETGVALSLSVSPPWWRSWNAYIGYMAAFIAALFLLLRYQRDRVRRAEREGRLAVVERDLQLTGAVQTAFLPERSEITTSNMQIVGVYRPADACGGDWWWHEPLRGGHHFILVGDVTGHGPGPAMVTAAVATAFRVLVENGLVNLEQALEHLNREVIRVGKGKYHMTMAALELDEASGEWLYYSAGAPPMFALDRSGKHGVHTCPGARLGTDVGFEIGMLRGRLQSGDRLLLFTDGIPEIPLPDGQVMGMRRFAREFEYTKSQGVAEAAAHIVGTAEVMKGTAPQGDDWTFLLLQWR